MQSSLLLSNPLKQSLACCYHLAGCKQLVKRQKLPPQVQKLHSLESSPSKRYTQSCVHFLITPTIPGPDLCAGRALVNDTKHTVEDIGGKDVKFALKLFLPILKEIEEAQWSQLGWGQGRSRKRGVWGQKNQDPSRCASNGAT